MPFGDYADFNDCVRKNSDKSDPEGYCGKIKHQIEGASVQKFEDNGRLYVKAFLLDASENINRWGVTKESLKSRIGTFIGRPLVLYQNRAGEFDHPELGDTVGHALAYQELFRIGTIIDVTEKAGVYSAIIEITDAGAKGAIQQKEIPFYVSPAIHKRVASEPENAISDWIGIHLAAVDDPAFTVKKATISAQCAGNEQQCLMQLRKAHVQRHGQGCGFCTKAALLAMADKLVINQASGPASSQEELTAPLDPTLENSNDNTDKAKVDQQNPANAAHADAGKSEIDKLKSENDSLRSEIAKTKSENDALKASTKEITGRVASLEQERRREKIASIITTDIIADDKTRGETIEKFVASNLSVEEIGQTFTPLAATIKKASVDSGKPKFDQYSKDGIRTASADSGKPAWLRAMELSVR